jgi:sterol desaturase/sphingolipid hydroxylase (fatty acid hydroxylase superfamily)
MAVLIITEMLYSAAHKQNLYEGRDTAVSLLCTSLNFLNDVAFRLVKLGILSWFYAAGLQIYTERGAVYWIMLFLAQDFAYYVLHCADHYCRIFWAMHVTHHSSEKFNLAVAIRSSVFQPYYRVLFFIPLALLGFKALDIVFMYAATQVYGFWVHTETIGKLPKWFEFIFVTPSHHRVHHASNIEYLDSNMGMVLIIWDRIFGTFKEERPDIKPRFGLTKNIDSYHPVKVVFHEWQSMFNDLKQSPNLKTALNYLIKPPGWSHNGRSLTAKQMREKQSKNKVINTVL